MNMVEKKEISDKKYKHYNDYYLKSILIKRANGLLKFVKIPYKINRILVSEFTNFTPNISRIDFVGEAEGNDKLISLILECQTELPTEEDIKRFFQYVSSIRVFKDNNVEVYILCIKKAPYEKKEFVLNDSCVYTMHIISLKDFKAKDIFENIENKLENNKKITDEDIASLQLIVYTDFNGSRLEILNKARKLLDRISQNPVFDINEKLAIIYLFDVLSANMLNEDDHNEYLEKNSMLVNPRERYFKNQGIKEGKLETARNLLKRGFSIEEIADITGLPEEEVSDIG